ncbi:MAG: hypothetical protein V7739_16290 [Motiliproteus sp.]
MAIKFKLFAITPAVFIAATLAVTAPATIEAAESEDGRHILILRPKERNAMLENMRNYLSSIRDITRSLAVNDLSKVEKYARQSGTIKIYEMKPVMVDAMVPRFRSLAIKVHEEFDQLANNAAAKKPAVELLGDLGRLMNNCVKCHETYVLGDFSHEK